MRDLSTLWAVETSVRQSAMHERYPGLNLFNYRHSAQLHRWCPRITPPTRHLPRADLARRSATILASEPPRSHNWACGELPAVAFTKWGAQCTTAAAARSENAGAAPWSANSLERPHCDSESVFSTSSADCRRNFCSSVRLPTRRPHGVLFSWVLLEITAKEQCASPYRRTIRLAGRTLR